jgi:hypothetical protein
MARLPLPPVCPTYRDFAESCLWQSITARLMAGLINNDLTLSMEELISYAAAGRAVASTKS